MYNYIFDPKTRTKINVNSKYGRVIIKKYINFFIAGSNYYLIKG